MGKVVDRLDLILKHIDKSNTGIEIGPSYRPICPKRDGWRVHTVDHATRDELRDKYKELSETEPLLYANIEEVDFIWKGGSLADLLKSNGVDKVDFIVASHMIEHTPCLLSFLHWLEELVAKNGVVSLAIPDKRREYDFLKPLSTTADVLDVYRHKMSRHSIRTACLAYFYECRYLMSPIWHKPIHVHDISFARPFEEARKLLDEYNSSETSPYTDFHAWAFTPSSFELMLMELNYLGYTKLAVLDIFDTLNYEFFVTLKPGISMQKRWKPEYLDRRRTDLIRRIHAELGEHGKRKREPRTIRTAVRKVWGFLDSLRGRPKWI